MPGPSRVRIGADVGGTFTDVLLQSRLGEVGFYKVLSSPPAYDGAVVEGVAELLGRSDVGGRGRARDDRRDERGAREARCADRVVTTAGLSRRARAAPDAMPHLYDHFWTKPPPLVPRRLRFEVDERMAAAGEVAARRSTTTRRGRVAARLRDADVESVAVCLLHAHLCPGHERCWARFCARAPGVPVSLSSEILREQQEYERTATTVVNAYVRPLMAATSTTSAAASPTSPGRRR